MASTSVVITDYKRQIPGSLSEDRKTWLFPQINSINAHRKKTEWRIFVKLFHPRDGFDIKTLTDDDFVEILDEYFDNKPMAGGIYAYIAVSSKIEGGKVRDVVPTVVKEGKNKGRANATNVFCQALRDALGLHNKQLKKAVNEHPAAAGKTERFPPMLATMLKDLKEPVPWANGVFVQRKYNGVRVVTSMDVCVNDDGSEYDCVIMYSRRKQLYPGFQYMKDELMQALKFYWEEGTHLYLDGEVYKHGMALQDISGYARREDKPTDVHIDYMVYDCFIPEKPDLKYSERKKILEELFSNFTHFKHVKQVETWKVSTEEDATKLYERFYREEGFEGAMVRLDVPYRYSLNEYHSKVLLKMKPAYDHEFEVVGWETGEKGKAAEALMIICQTEEGKHFPVTPAMEIPDRIALAKKMALVEADGKTHFENHWKGKKIIVVFDEWSKDKVPQRARTELKERPKGT